METLKKLAQLFLIWMITLSALSACTAIMEHQLGSERFFSTMFVMMLYSMVLSLPAFIFFSIFSFKILNSNRSLARKKLNILLINYADIAGTFIIIFVLMPAGFGDLTRKVITLQPFWALVISSSAAILLMPFNHQQNINTQN